MKASKQFIADFDYLAGIYKWTATEIAEMKQWIRSAQHETTPYITALASEWRKAEGYG